MTATAAPLTRAVSIGFPAGRLPVDWTSTVPHAFSLINNVGDPWGAAADDAGMADERYVVNWLLDLFGAPAHDRWGWVTSGSSAAIEYGLHLGRTRYPDAPIYLSAAAHPCVTAAADKLRMRTIVVPVDAHDELDLDALADLTEPGVPAIVLATIGTTMCEAIDDIARIRQTLRRAGAGPVWVHADAALAGVPLALDAQWSWRVRLGQHGADADSLSLSGHKFLSVPIPCGVLLCRRTDSRHLARPLSYTRSTNPTSACSRPGITPRMLRAVIDQLGREGLARHARTARAVADHAHRSLLAVGVDAHRHPHALTVTFPTPSDELVTRWSLAAPHGRSHLIAMPGIPTDLIDTFISELVST